MPDVMCISVHTVYCLDTYISVVNDITVVKSFLSADLSQQLKHL